MDIFLSYSSAQRDIAHRLALSLEGQGHHVFFDRTDLPQGGEYDARIRDAIEHADLFVFLISPESVAPGSYPRAELGMAERLWPHPAGRVLPVLVAPVTIDAVPPYARAISMLKPQGEVVAEVSAAVARMASRGRWHVAPVVAAVLLLAIAGLAWTWYQRAEGARVQEVEVAGILSAARLDIEAGQYEAAFEGLAAAQGRFPEEPRLRHAQEDAAMSWAREIRVVAGQRTFADVVGIVRPVLSAGAAGAEGERAADLLAHLGWCEYLLDRETVSGNPETYFRRAVDIDPANPYARAMWGFWNFTEGAGVEQIAEHFEKAASTGRERPWVRNLQISAMLFRPSREHEIEAVRVASTMRKEGVAVEYPNRLWSIMQSQLLYGRGELLDALPADELLLTFQWLFPEGSVVEDRRLIHGFMAARLEEAAGNRQRALERYRQLEAELKRTPGSLQDRTLEGIRRLTGTP